jgi:5-methylcytosine-specific restriction endonuclease McrA
VYRQSIRGKRKQAEWSKTYAQSEKGKRARKIQIHSTAQKRKAALYARWYRTTDKGKMVNQVGQSKCKAKRLKAEGTHTTIEWIALKEIYQHRCLRCGKHESKLSQPLQEDHVIPLSKGGTNWITNIQPLCKECNGMGGKGVSDMDYRTVFRLHL